MRLASSAKHMSGYQLRERLSFCLIDGRPFFLDARADRYFRLCNEMEHLFLSLLNDPSDSHAGRVLVECGVLNDAEDGLPCTAQAELTSFSVLEMPSMEQRHGALLFFEVAAIVHQTKRRLNKYGLEPTLRWCVACSANRSSTQDAAVQLDMARWSGAFLKTRKYVATPTRCLLDSLAMMKFLGRRGLYPKLVFGVTGEPFTAHCWLQAGQTLLNDNVGNTRAYTPIKVV